MINIFPLNKERKKDACYNNNINQFDGKWKSLCGINGHLWTLLGFLTFFKVKAILKVKTISYLFIVKLSEKLCTLNPNIMHKCLLQNIVNKYSVLSYIKDKIQMIYIHNFTIFLKQIYAFRVTLFNKQKSARLFVYED